MHVLSYKRVVDVDDIAGVDHNDVVDNDNNVVTKKRCCRQQ